jgi:meiotic recombination protein SPO11
MLKVTSSLFPTFFCKGELLFLHPDTHNRPQKLRPQPQVQTEDCCNALQNQEEYKGEILEMLVSGQKAEIEALYAHGYNFLTRFITQKLVQRDYI